ncbi:hypothetical protein CFter6_4952 [Collimonas fungivorans]|uniref:Uncharacterized protein n=1 Tax=Collimonas fungivorans TaxID=158899 RepID=A0A127PI79_9BURK|nr:hypothetical protein CFter6_4952 [Collimonas fungivorans]
MPDFGQLISSIGPAIQVLLQIVPLIAPKTRQAACLLPG